MNDNLEELDRIEKELIHLERENRDLRVSLARPVKYRDDEGRLSVRYPAVPDDVIAMEETYYRILDDIADADTEYNRALLRRNRECQILLERIVQRRRDIAAARERVFKQSTNKRNHDNAPIQET